MRKYGMVSILCCLASVSWAAQFSDFNRNGLPDVFTFNSNGIDWYERGETGEYIKAGNDILDMSGIKDVVAADIDKDGKAELVVAIGGASGGVYWYGCEGNAVVYEGGLSVANAASLCVGYFDPDGNPDVLIGQDNGAGTGRLDWFEYRLGTGLAWVKDIAYVPVKRRNAAIYNVNGKGYMAYLPSVANNYVNTLYSDQDNALGWSWLAGQEGATNMQGLLVDDLDGNGFADLLTCDRGYTLWYKYDASGKPQFYSYNSFTTSGTWSIMKSGYFASATDKTYFLAGDPDGLARYNGPSFAWIASDSNPVRDLVIVRYSTALGRGDMFIVRNDGMIVSASNNWWLWLTNDEYQYDGAAVADAVAASQCGDAGIEYSTADFNRDCVVDFADFAEFAGKWLSCSDPQGCF